jgi:uncharacterized protein (TIGR03085 family)
LTVGMARHAGPQPGSHAGRSPAAFERAELCELLTQVGEHAPTLCEGWEAVDLAAHLLVRESRPDALIGLAIPPFRGYTTKLEVSAREKMPFAEIVGRLRSGPSLRTPLGLPVIKDRGNLHEFFIHHEDVRRAQPGWLVRELSAQETAELWRLVRLMAPMLLRGVPKTRVTLATAIPGASGTAERSVGKADAPHQVTVTGPPGELLLYLSGRQPVAEVKISGPPAGQAQLAAASLGM